MKWLNKLGPGFVVTAAFIGPGTITTASVAGARFGFALLWALAFSVFATIVLQEMSARLGLVTRRGLGESIRLIGRNPYLRTGAIALVVAGIGLGNAAFQTGNITGAAMGLQAVTGLSHQVWTLVVGGIAFGLLSCSVYKVLERALIGLVVVMSVVFLLTAIVVQPEIRAIVAGISTPNISSTVAEISIRRGFLSLIFRLQKRTPGTSLGSMQWSPLQALVLSWKILSVGCPTAASHDTRYPALYPMRMSGPSALYGPL